jgi:ABC-type bacteriocin/lantibiotic exporter with double-glycine peptidase domain
MQSLKEKFDSKFPEAKIVREIEIKRTSHNLFSQSTIGKITPIIYLIIAIGSIFLYNRYFHLSIIISIILGIVTWFVVTYIFDKLLIKILGIEKAVRKINDDEIEKLEKESDFLSKILK